MWIIRDLLADIGLARVSDRAARTAAQLLLLILVATGFFFIELP
jgi:hypothetical protein